MAMSVDCGTMVSLEKKAKYRSNYMGELCSSSEERRKESKQTLVRLQW